MTAAADPHAEAVRALCTADARLAPLVQRVGPCRLALRAESDHFAGLVQAIVSQQLSSKAADTIFGRLKAAAGPTLDAAAIVALPDARLREAGLSGAKARYVRGLGEAALAGTIALDRLDTMTNDDVLEELCRLKGVGRWTAEMILMFRLGRLDVLPVDDLGIQKGMMRLFKLRKLPEKKRMTTLAKPWRPYRSIACWYLWRLAEER
jgi:DNA-3-methyladenine glycosylase II